MSAQEKIIWEGSPSQVTNLGVYIVCTLLVVPVPYAIWRWIVMRCFRYSVSDQRIDASNSTGSRTWCCCSRSGSGCTDWAMWNCALRT